MMEDWVLLEFEHSRTVGGNSPTTWFSGSKCLRHHAVAAPPSLLMSVSVCPSTQLCTNLLHHGGFIGVNFGFLCVWTVLIAFGWLHQFGLLPKIRVEKIILMGILGNGAYWSLALIGLYTKERRVFMHVIYTGHIKDKQISHGLEAQDWNMSVSVFCCSNK